MIGNGLAYLSVVVRDVEAVAEMLNRDFKLEPSMLTVGVQRDPCARLSHRGDRRRAVRGGRPIRWRSRAHRRTSPGRRGGRSGEHER